MRYNMTIEFVTHPLQQKGLVEMKSRILSTIAVIALIAFVILYIYAVTAYPMHIGEPSYYHVARVECLLKATICGFASFIAAIAAAEL